jgi:hypothetical protein
MPRKNTLSTQFFKDLRTLQAKYPMCFIDAWTPDDYEFALAMGEEPDAELEENADWSHDRYVWASRMVSKRKDANNGIDWDWLSIVLEDLHNDY